MVYDPLPYEEAAPGSAMDIGNRVGVGAHALFPGGVEVTEAPWEHQLAIRKTQQLMEDPEVPAIFEGAFEFEGVRVRVDVLERLKTANGDTWGLREVKSSLAVREESLHVEDAAIQLHVLEGSDVSIDNVELVHVSRDYILEETGIEWDRILYRADITEAARCRMIKFPDELKSAWNVLEEAEPPEVQPFKSTCNKPYGCDYWERCTAAKPKDWIQSLPRIGLKVLKKLTDDGIEGITGIPDDFPLNANQERMRNVLISGEPYVSEDLFKSLHNFGPPAYYLDFEFMNAILPPYPGTHPNQGIAFQYSLHHVDANGNVEHFEFLGDPEVDPRRELAERLIRDVKDDQVPILAYNAGTEVGVIRNLIALFPDLSTSLEVISDRILDLLPIVRNHTYFEGYQGSFSLKAVGPTLVPELTYSTLDGVSVGTDAARVFWLLTMGDIEDPEEAYELQRQLLDYCKLDTLLLLEVHRCLREIATKKAEPQVMET